jgi:hypothetical protein
MVWVGRILALLMLLSIPVSIYRGIGRARPRAYYRTVRWRRYAFWWGQAMMGVMFLTIAWNLTRTPYPRSISYAFLIT